MDNFDKAECCVQNYYHNEIEKFCNFKINILIFHVEKFINSLKAGRIKKFLSRIAILGCPAVLDTV